MQIDSCGSNSDKLKEMFKIMRKNSNEPITVESDSYLDSQLYKAYQDILNIAHDGTAVSDALYNMSKRVESGNISPADLDLVAVESAVEAVDNIRKLEIRNEIVDTAFAATVTVAIVGGALNLHEKEVLETLDTPEMEDKFSNTYKKLQEGDKQALKSTDLIRRAQNYVLNKDRLNPKGAESGALALIYQLSMVGDEASLIVAKQVAESFGITEVLENGNVNPEKANLLFSRKHPTKSLDAARRRHDNYVDSHEEDIKNRTTSSNRQNVLIQIENRRVRDFSRTLQHLIKEGNQAQVTEFILAHRDLAQKAYESEKAISGLLSGRADIFAPVLNMQAPQRADSQNQNER